MILNDFLNDRRFPKLLKEYWHIEFSFNYKDFEESNWHELVVLGYSFFNGEYYKESLPYSHYYKRYGNLLKIIPKKEKTVTKIKVGCSGRNFDAVFYLDVPEHDTLDKFFNLFKEI